MEDNNIIFKDEDKWKVSAEFAHKNCWLYNVLCKYNYEGIVDYNPTITSRCMVFTYKHLQIRRYNTNVHNKPKYKYSYVVSFARISGCKNTFYQSLDNLYDKINFTGINYLNFKSHTAETLDIIITYCPNLAIVIDCISDSYSEVLKRHKFNAVYLKINYPVYVNCKTLYIDRVFEVDLQNVTADLLRITSSKALIHNGDKIICCEYLTSSKLITNNLTNLPNLLLLYTYGTYIENMFTLYPNIVEYSYKSHYQQPSLTLYNENHIFYDKVKSLSSTEFIQFVKNHKRVKSARNIGC